MLVNMLEAKNQLSRLVKAAQAGEEVVIAQRGVPAVRLVPINPGDQAHLKRSHEAIEAEIQAERHAWD